MRNNLIKARKGKKLTQSQLAKYLRVSARHYQNIEYGIRKGSFEVWDKLEDLFKIPQRQLRENTKIEKENKNNEKHKNI